MTRYRSIVLAPVIALALGLLSACARVAPESIALTTHLDSAVERLAAQSEGLITTLTAYHLDQLDQSWLDLYQRAESAFREHNKLSPDGPLDPTQRATIAAIAAESHDRIRLRIEQARDDLLGSVRHNTGQALAINASIRKHLESLSTLNETQSQINASVESMIDIPIREHLEELASIFHESTKQENTQ